MSENEIQTLYKIKNLFKIGFSLNQIRIILNIAKNELLLDMFDQFWLYEEKEFNCFIKNYRKWRGKTSIDIVSREYFGFFQNELVAKNIMFELFELEKVWYHDSENKKILKNLKKKFICVLKITVKIKKMSIKN